MAYTIRYTISSLSGVYALKYSVCIHDAARLAALLPLSKAPVEMDGFASGGAVRQYDAFAAFNALMKVLKYVMRDPKRTFCTAIEAVSGESSSRAESFEDADAQGAFKVQAMGLTGVIIRGEDRQKFEEIQGEKALYRAIVEPMRDVFKADLENLLNLCEEALAKDAAVVATQVQNDAPEAAPLFQLEVQKRK